MTEMREKIILLLLELVSDIDGRIQKMYEVSKGLECRILVEKVPIGGILFRAFIPLSGYPVELDLFAEGFSICNNEYELVNEIKNIFPLLIHNY